jgi:hypothetical protein
LVSANVVAADVHCDEVRVQSAELRYLVAEQVLDTGSAFGDVDNDYGTPARGS